MFDFIGIDSYRKMESKLDILSKEDVQKCINSDVLIEKLEFALADYSKGEDGGTQQPLRLTIPVDHYKGYEFILIFDRFFFFVNKLVVGLRNLRKILKSKLLINGKFTVIIQVDSSIK